MGVTLTIVVIGVVVLIVIVLRISRLLQQLHRHNGYCSLNIKYIAHHTYCMIPVDILVLLLLIYYSYRHCLNFREPVHDHLLAF